MTRRLVLLAAPILLLACAGILGIRSNSARRFEHRAHVLAGVACVTCHTEVVRSTLESAPNIPSTQTCLGCHQTPHDTRACGQCHGQRGDRMAAAEAKRHLLFAHADHHRVAEGQCVRCHAAVGGTEGPLRPTMATCLSCHEHREQWDARTCNGCHRDVRAEQTPPASHVVHGGDFLKNHGIQAAASRDLCTTCHSESTCAGCHGVSTAALPSRLHFDDLRRNDMHGGNFAARHALAARADPALCASCHEPSTCLDCHRARGLLRADVSRRSPHPAAWLSTAAGGGEHGRQARRDPMACASCHGGAGESLCVGCHRVGGAGGTPHPPGFRSRKRDSELPCRLCHEGPR